MRCTVCAEKMIRKKSLINRRKIKYICPSCGNIRRMEQIKTLKSESLGEATVWIDK